MKILPQIIFFSQKLRLKINISLYFINICNLLNKRCIGSFWKEKNWYRQKQDSKNYFAPHFLNVTSFAFVSGMLFYFTFSNVVFNQNCHINIKLYVYILWKSYETHLVLKQEHFFGPKLSFIHSEQFILKICKLFGLDLRIAAKLTKLYNV